MNRRDFTKLSTLGALSATTIGFIPTIDAKEEATHFYFVQITDTHMNAKNHTERTIKVIDAINKLPMEIEFVAHTGDITNVNGKSDDTSAREKAAEILSTLKPPVYYVAGNHDIRNERSRGVHIELFGPLIQQFEHHGVVFIFVYTEPLAKNRKVPGYDPLLELEDRLIQAKEKPVFVFHHSPSVEDFYKNTLHVKWDQENKRKWDALLNQYKVKGVLAGHFHRDEHHKLGEGVPLYVSASIASSWGRQASFRIYEYKDGKLGYRTQYIED